VKSNQEKPAAGPAKIVQDTKLEHKKDFRNFKSLRGSLAQLLIAFGEYWFQRWWRPGFIYRVLPWRGASEETALDFTNEKQ
jgi:hypothetical protein